MKKNKQNTIDQIISNLAERLSKIPNFELIQTDGEANRVFNFVITRFSEIQDYKTLYSRYFIPATNKALIDTKKELRTSTYKKILNISESQLKENYYDTIRLGYVGLFHKIENYVKDLLFEANLLYNEGKTGKDSIEKYFEKKYGFKFNDWYSDIYLHKINWICNCVKHYDGYPKKEPKYEYLKHLSEHERIKINHQEFYKDIDYVSNTFYQFKLSQVFMFAVFKMTSEEFTEDIIDEDIKTKLADFEMNIKKMMI